MDLSKIKSGYRDYDYEINALLGIKVGQQYLIVDENKEPYKIYCNTLNGGTYQCLNERGDLSISKKKPINAVDFVVESVNGSKNKINLDKEKDFNFSVSFIGGEIKIVPMSLICYAICNDYKVLSVETFEKLTQSDLVKLAGAGVGLNCVFEERYVLRVLGKDFLSADFNLLSKDKIERFITNSSLVEYNDFDESKMLKREKEGIEKNKKEEKVYGSLKLSDRKFFENVHYALDDKMFN